MKSFNELTKVEIEENYKKEKEIYDNYCKMNLNLNIISHLKKHLRICLITIKVG